MGSHIQADMPDCTSDGFHTNAAFCETLHWLDTSAVLTEGTKTPDFHNVA